MVVNEKNPSRSEHLEAKQAEKSAKIAVVVFPLIMIGSFFMGISIPEKITVFSPWLNWMLALTMFSMGLSLRLPDFTLVLRYPKPVLIGVATQFIAMPLIGWLTVQIVPLPKEIAVGIILVGCVPGGTTSNVVSFLAKGNTALSVTMTALSTLLAPIVTPLATWALAGKYMEVNGYAMAISIVQIVIIPVFLGLVINQMVPQIVMRFMGILPWVGVLAISAVITTVVANSASQIYQVSWLMALAIFLENSAGYGVGYAVARACGLSRRERKTISIEVGLQNAGLGSQLAATYFTPLVAVPAACAAFWHTISGACLAMYWRLREK